MNGRGQSAECNVSEKIGFELESNTLHVRRLHTSLTADNDLAYSELSKYNFQDMEKAPLGRAPA